MKILMIDDEPQFTISHGEALEDEGYQVYRTSNLDEALELLQTQNFKAIILDLLMPPKMEERNKKIPDLRQTGVNLHLEIRTRLRLSVPIIIMSVVRDRSILDKIRKNDSDAGIGVSYFLQKPVRPSELVNMVTRALE